MIQNVTKDQVEAFMKALPDEMNSNEISALVMTVINAYLEEVPREAVALLMSTTILYAHSVGMPAEAISKILHSAGDNVVKNPISGRTH